jgi:CBS domain-containing membrane protein
LHLFIMPDDMPTWLHNLLPAKPTVSLNEQVRASTGALLGLALTAGLCLLWLGSAAVWLIAPMGASSVLLFCLPGSPLAQPWAVIGGNTVSALVGVACYQLFGDVWVAAPLAGSVAIATMFALRCLHPPGGAVALTAVLAAPAVHAMGYQFALVPVALNSSLLVGAAVAFHRLTGKRYPHPQRSALDNPHLTGDPVPSARLRHLITRSGQTHSDKPEVVGQIMSSKVTSASVDTPIVDLVPLMANSGLHHIPVLDAERRFAGMVTQSDVIAALFQSRLSEEAPLRAPGVVAAR